jgi:hypothetical protein
VEVDPLTEFSAIVPPGVVTELKFGGPCAIELAVPAVVQTKI